MARTTIEPVMYDYDAMGRQGIAKNEKIMVAHYEYDHARRPFTAESDSAMAKPSY